jgi:hypothetical protein
VVVYLADARRTSSVTSVACGLFLFQPRLLILIGDVWWGGPAGQSDFAVAEEPHYLCIEPFSWYA